MRSAQAAMVVTDVRAPDEPIVFANPAFAALTGYSPSEALGRNCRFLQGVDTDPAELSRLRAAVGARAPIALDILNYRKDGVPFWNALSLSPIPGADGDVGHMLGVMSDVTPRKLAEHSLESAVAQRAAGMDQALKQATALLHEVDHRVKNNLQLIASLLLLQSRRVEDETARMALRGMLERVSAIATVHRRLFQSEDIERFDVAQFVRDLTADLMAASGRPEIQMRLDLERVDVPAAQAAPAALVINELVGNALRHAFPEGRSGVIDVNIRRRDTGFEVAICDDGVGLPGREENLRGFGLTIAHLLSRQLRASLQFEDSQPGVRAFVTLPTSK
jgi:PAS domain S-box-containing protein